MSSSFVLRSTLPRTFASATGRNVLRTVLQARRVSSDLTAISKGTVNDPTTFPPPSKTHGSYHWAFERLLSAATLPMTAAAFATSGTAYPVLDGLLGISLVMHSHIGFDAILVDYLHYRKFPTLGPLTTWTLRATTVGVWSAFTNSTRMILG
ncbi:mitochondrial inner membrane protein [Boletus reticuloceps]|uniref:Succinate dehydrogenase [ubiquinone] cytochrome b small subunit n=1 Tax=Boletus reticuloceps TaxID=495285 RepID=A0A8I2YX14_9AGAM|nr:mitochondrial inner membrane protein [Boletus reticuloceps]